MASGQSKQEDAVRKAEKLADKAAKKAAKPGPKVLEKNLSTLEKLDVEYVPIDSLKPNSYNPNRQSAHDFSLLCSSISEDGFTQPVVAQQETREIVDGEHRWRACKALGFTEIAVVWTAMSPEQMRISTLRHNRARGSEDENLAGDVLKQLAEMGGLEAAAESLMLDPVEVNRMMKDMGPTAEANLIPDEMVTPEMLGPSGKGQSEQDLLPGSKIDLAADTFRAKQKLLELAKYQEETQMAAQDSKIYRLMLFFTGTEANAIRTALDHGDGQAKNLLALCKRAAGVI